MEKNDSPSLTNRAIIPHITVSPPDMRVNASGEIVQVSNELIELDPGAEDHFVGQEYDRVVKPFSTTERQFDTKEAWSGCGGVEVEGHVELSNGDIHPVKVESVADRDVVVGVNIESMYADAFVNRNGQPFAVGTITKDGEFSTASSYLEQLLGISLLDDEIVTVEDIGESRDNTGGEILLKTVREAITDKEEKHVTLFETGGAMSVNCVVQPSGIAATIKATYKTDMESQAEHLHKSLREYKGVFKNPYLSVVVVSLDDGLIIDLNETAVGIFDVSRQDLIGERLKDTCLWQNRESASAEFDTLIEQIKNGEQASLQISYEVEGDTQWLRVQCAPIFDDDGAVIGFGIIGMNITPYKRTQSQLQSTQRQYDALFNNPYGFTTLLDSERCIIEINENAAVAAEEPVEELLGSKVYNTSLVTNQLTDVDIKAKIEKALSGEIVEETYSIPVENETKWFTVLCFPIINDGEVTNVFTYGQEITDHVESERQREFHKKEKEMYEELARISDEINCELASKTSQESVFETTFDVLQRSPQHDSVWIGEYNPRAETVTQLHSTINPADKARGEPISVEEFEGSVVTDVILNNEAKHVTCLDSSGVGFDQLQENGCCGEFANGECSMVIIPMTTNNATYGVIGCCVDQDLTTGRCIEAWQLLGEVIGQKTREIRRGEFSASSENTQLNIFTEQAGAEFSDMFPVSGELTITSMHNQNGQLIKHGNATGMTVDEVKDAMTYYNLGEPEIEAGSLHDDCNEITVKTVSDNDGLLSIARNDRVELDSIVVQDTGLHLRFNIPKGEPPRDTLNTVQEDFPDARIESRKVLTRGDQPQTELISSLREDLTDRQKTILQVAAENGYWDLSNSANQQDLAEELDISPSTLREHLNKGCQTVFNSLF